MLRACCSAERCLRTAGTRTTAAPAAAASSTEADASESAVEGEVSQTRRRGTGLLKGGWRAAGRATAATGALASAMFWGMWIGSFASSLADAIGPGRLMLVSLVGLLLGALPLASIHIVVAFANGLRSIQPYPGYEAEVTIS